MNSFLLVAMLQFAEKEGFQYIKERLSTGGLDAPVSGYCWSTLNFSCSESCLHWIEYLSMLIGGSHTMQVTCHSQLCLVL